MSEAISLASSDLRLTLSPFGAEMQSLTDSKGRDLLWNGDPAFWSGRAPLLFPLVGGLVNDRYRHKGLSYTLPRHGFARRSAFALEHHNASLAVFALHDSEETRAAYPFAFRLEVAYRVDGPSITTTIIVSNRGDEPMPFAFGFHPAFRWPLPEGGQRQDHRLIFAQDENAPLRRLNGKGQLMAHELKSPIDGRMLALDDTLFADDAMVYTALASTSLTYQGTSGPRLHFAWQGLPHMGLWSKPGAPFLCIEPWQGYADPEGFAGEISDKPGMVLLPPGQSHTMSLTIRVEDHSSPS